MSWNMIFEGWAFLGRTLVVGLLAYGGLLLLLRISGKRTLSKMNAFDFVVTVALGSTLASVLTSKQVSLAQGLLAFALLIGLQAVVTWIGTRSRRFLALIKSEPALLFFRGDFLDDAMRRERIAEAEIRQAARSQGIADLEEVEAVVLETDGTFSVIKKAEGGSAESLLNVDEWRKRIDGGE